MLIETNNNSIHLFHSCRKWGNDEINDNRKCHTWDGKKKDDVNNYARIQNKMKSTKRKKSNLQCVYAYKYGITQKFMTWSNNVKLKFVVFFYFNTLLSISKNYFIDFQGKFFFLLQMLKKVIFFGIINEMMQEFLSPLVQSFANCEWQ